jgi:O-antigen ligase
VFLGLFFRPIAEYIGLASQISYINGRYVFLLGLFLIFSCGYKKNYNKFFSHGLPLFLCLFLLIFLFYVIGPQSNYSNYKLTNFFVRGLPKIFFFFVLFTQKIDSNKIINLIFLTSILYITAVFNFEFSSNFFFEYGLVRFKTIYANSHLIGNYPLIGFSILLGQWFYNEKKNPKSNNKILFIGYAVILILSIFISGARQSIVFLILIPLITVFIYQKSFLKNLRFYLVIVVFSIAGIQYLYQSDISIINSTLNSSSIEESLNRVNEVNHTIEIIKNEPILGTGLGGFAEGLTIQNKYKEFDSNLGRAFPHNIILEILTEMGIIGLFLLILFFFSQKGIRSFYNYISRSKFYIFPLFLGINLKYMISYDFTQSVEIFSFVIAYLTYFKITNNGLSRNSNI